MLSLRIRVGAAVRAAGAPVVPPHAGRGAGLARRRRRSVRAVGGRPAGDAAALQHRHLDQPLPVAAPPLARGAARRGAGRPPVLRHLADAGDVAGRGAAVGGALPRQDRPAGARRPAGVEPDGGGGPPHRGVDGGGGAAHRHRRPAGARLRADGWRASFRRPAARHRGRSDRRIVRCRTVRVLVAARGARRCSSAWSARPPLLARPWSCSSSRWCSSSRRSCSCPG